MMDAHMGNSPFGACSEIRLANGVAGFVHRFVARGWRVSTTRRMVIEDMETIGNHGDRSAIFGLHLK